MLRIPLHAGRICSREAAAEIALLISLLLVAADVQPLAAIEPDKPQSSPLKLDAKTSSRCLELLREGMRSNEFWPSIHAAEGLTLAGHGDEVRELLITKLEAETDDQRRCGLARELVRAGDLSHIAVMLKILAKKDPHGHTHAAESLYKVGEIGDGRLLRAAAAQQESPTFALMAAAALAKCGSPAALEKVRNAATNKDPTISRIAAWILGRIGEETDVAQLRQNLRAASEPITRAYIEHALAALGDSAGQKALLANLASDDAAIRTYAATFAGDARMNSAAGRLTSLLDDETLDVRLRAAQTLLQLSAPPAANAGEVIVRDVYPASDDHPRYTEGSILRLADGTLFYAVTEFIGGGSDFAAAQIIARSSRDGGRTWGEPRILQRNVGGKNVMSVTLRRLEPPAADSGPIGLFYLVKNSYSDLRVYLRVSRDECKTFGPAIRVTTEPGYHVMNNDRVTLLSSGRLLVPVASTEDVRRVNHFVSRCYLSDDAGKTWREGSGSVDLSRRGAMEPEVVELEPGRVMMIVRTQLGYIAVSYSEDGGNTWTKPVSWNVKSPEAPATLRRVPATGDLLLIWNNNYEEGTGHGGRRTPLSAALSSDNGRTWSDVKNLETEPAGSFAYTSLTFTGPRAVLSYWVGGKPAGRLSNRFRSLPVSWFYRP